MKRLAAICAVVAFSVISQAALSTAQARVYEGQVDFAAGDAGAEQEAGLTIEWDHWRNSVLHAAWVKWGEMLEGGLSIGTLKLSMGGKRSHSFPNGTNATFHCTITKERRIENLSITQSSGDAEFDELVLASIRGLQGSRALAFPKQSQRNSVEQSGTFRIGKTAFHEARFGDVEQAPAR